MSTPPSMRSIWQARAALSGQLPKAPLISSPKLSARCGVPVSLKLETVLPSGSFKIRGALNFLASLSEKEKKQGVSAFSTGNHGLAVAHAAKKQGIRAVIFVSETVPQLKKEALQESGAEIIIGGKSQDDAEAACRQRSEQEGLTVVPPFDHPAIISGQGTIGLEILEDMPDVSSVLGGLSGGGLMGGVGLALKNTDPYIDIAGISVQKGAAMDESIQAGRPVEVAESPTLADSLLGGIGNNNQYSFPAIKKYVDTRIRVSETDIAKGMAYLYKYHRIIAEGGGAVGVSALLNGSVKLKGPAVVIISGASIDVEILQKNVNKYLESI